MRIVALMRRMNSAVLNFIAGDVGVAGGPSDILVS
jgi:hypothetical protein